MNAKLSVAWQPRFASRFKGGVGGGYSAAICSALLSVERLEAISSLCSAGHGWPEKSQAVVG